MRTNSKCDLQILDRLLWTHALVLPGAKTQQRNNTHTYNKTIFFNYFGKKCICTAYLELSFDTIKMHLNSASVMCS